MKNLRFQNTEEALATLTMATEATGLGVWDLNVETGELHWSARCREIFGVSPDSPLLYSDFLDRLDPSERDMVDRVVQSALDPAGLGQYEIEFRIVRPSGDIRWAAAKGRAFFEHADGRSRAVRFLGTILDRTEQQLSQRALILSEQMAATGRLAASIAHEINNPLEAVTNLLFLAKGEEDAEVRARYLSQAESELARVSEIASNTLRFYRNPIGTALIDVSGLLESVLNLFRGRLSVCRITLSSRLQHGSCVRAAQGELRQVLVNLLDNAVDATPKGGTILVRCRYFARSIVRDTPAVLVSVADTGSGMSPEVLRHISEPFFTTKGASGTGLGLWVSMEILRRFGFKLKVRSRVNQGTVFSVIMPVLEG